MQSHDIPDRPGQKVGADLFDKENYLAMTGYYSKFIEISISQNMTGKTVINHIKSQYARHPHY